MAGPSMVDLIPTQFANQLNDYYYLLLMNPVRNHSLNLLDHLMEIAANFYVHTMCGLRGHPGVVVQLPVLHAFDTPLNVNTSKTERRMMRCLFTLVQYICVALLVWPIPCSVPSIFKWKSMRSQILFILTGSGGNYKVWYNATPCSYVAWAKGGKSLL